MGLAENLKGTATTLINTFGNTVTIATETNDNTYNPQTGVYGNPVAESYSKRSYVAPATNEELMQSGLPENEWGAIKFVAMFVEDTDTARLDNKWTIDNIPVSKVVKTSAQDTQIVLKAYCG